MQGNTVNLVGRLGREVECKYFESGSNVSNVSLAVNRRQKDAPPDWFELEAWGKVGEVLANYGKKGGQIGVTGSIYQQSWVDKTTGRTRFKPVLRVDELTLLGSAKSGGSDEFDGEF